MYKTILNWWTKFLTKKKYKYTLKTSVYFYIKELKGITFSNDFVSINNGVIVIKRGYSWDGCTLAPDSLSSYLGSLLHDALYQFKIVDQQLADYLFYRQLIKDRHKFAKLYYIGVILFGEYFY